MTVRRWMSGFLHHLASRIDSRSPVQVGHTDQAVPSASSESFVNVGSAETGRGARSEIPASIRAAPRSPALESRLVAAYWRAALKYVDFNALRTHKNEPLLQFPLHDAAARATSTDPNEDDLVDSEDVDVVLFLWENGQGGKMGKKRHPLIAVPAVQLKHFLAPRTDAAPILNPAYLADPRGDAFRYGDAEQANLLLTEALYDLASDKTLVPGWDTWWNTSLNVLFKLCQVNDEKGLLQFMSDLANASCTIPPAHGWQLRVATFAGKGSGVNSISDAYASYLESAKAPVSTLFDRFCGSEAANWASQMPLALDSGVVGHIDEYDSAKDERPLFPLDRSQRLAVRAIASLDDGELQAVNGPPGSGKTSMLRAVVASRWVRAALEQSECPIIVACGATNQSVTNVIEAFGKAPHPDTRLAIAQRWIGEVPSYGAYFPAASVLKDEKKAAELARFICVTASKGSGMLWEYHKRPNVLDPTQGLGMEERYLTHARVALDHVALTRVEDVVSVVWNMLYETVKQGEDFASVDSRASGRWLAILDDALKGGDSDLWAKARVEALDGLRDKLTLNLDDVEAAQGIVDLVWRPRAFHLAGRYWEGRFLLAQRERLFSRHPLNVEESLRRLCMLTPCLVSTLHNVPNCFRFQVPHGEDPTYAHLLSTIDLLVIDEAGQASPELAGAALLLARRAAVIGDLKQLAPIWNHTDLSEVAIAASIGAYEQINALRQSQRSVADGSVLAAARLVSRWREDDDLGITLRYHYRCKPSIIGYCNMLCYEDKLVPRTREDPEGPEPALAWVALRQSPQKQGGSLYNNTEVDHITSWVAERWPIWQAHPSTSGRRLSDIVALITAYRAQADRLRVGLKAAFARCRNGKREWPSDDDIDKVTIGTVHQLQGAERPIVCFSLVEGPDEAAGSFMDRDGSLLNVAVSRAKSSFIVFGHPERLFPALQADGDTSRGLAPIHALGDYLRKTKQAEVLYPKDLVIIEAGGKLQAISGILGKTSKVICTSGALQMLPIGKGVDVAAGLVPRPQLQSNAGTFNDLAGDAMEGVQSMILATDDDRMGEFIAWQVLQSLKSKLLPAHISRVRLGSINGPAVREAFANRTVLDERKVLSEAVREVVDCLISSRLLASQLKSAAGAEQTVESLAVQGACTSADTNNAKLSSVGRVQAAVLRLLLDRGRECVSHAGKSRILIRFDIGGKTLTGYALNLSEQRALTSSDTVSTLVAKIKDRALAPVGRPEVLRERVEVPRAGTFSVLAEAWRRFGCTPWASMDALQRLYDGSWANTEGTGDFEPEIPVTCRNEGGGHPPIVPLDLAAHPKTVASVMATPDCRTMYQIIWDRHEMSAKGPFELTQVRVDLRFDGMDKQDLGIRFEAFGCDQLSDVQMCLLLESDDVANEAEHLITHWQDLSEAPRNFESEAAGRWLMTLDQLLLEMQRAHIGRPSTCSRSLRGLHDKGLVEIPIKGGQVRLTPSGAMTALALEAYEPAISSPAFCTLLSQQLELIECGDVGPREVLGRLLPDLVPDCPDMDGVRNRIWNSLPELERAQNSMQATGKGGLISSQTDGIRLA